MTIFSIFSVPIWCWFMPGNASCMAPKPTKRFG